MSNSEARGRRGIALASRTAAAAVARFGRTALVAAMRTSDGAAQLPSTRTCGAGRIGRQIAGINRGAV